MIMHHEIILLFSITIFAVGACVATERPKTTSQTEQNMIVVKNGEAYTDIIIPQHASTMVRNSAATLSDYIFKSSGAKLNIVEEGVIDRDTNHIFLGHTKFFQDQNINIKHLNKQGFIITFPDDKSAIITGQTDDAVEFGIYEFLERYIGVRWLFPGELGEYVPENKTVTLKRNNIEQQPAFHSRLLGGISFEEGTIWARRNRMLSTMSFHHNLGNLFRPAKYTKTNPEFFPVINGRRRQPTTLVGWQPCFTAKGSEEETAKNIMNVFEKHPDKISISLGANDNSGFCECDNCKALDGNILNSVGIPSRSESYYRWCNNIVAKVLSKYPDKYFGLLAYNDIIDPMKSEKLHRHIIPYLCYDRMKWMDKDVEKSGKLLNERWAENVDALGWYDYIYGCRFYIIPRVYFHQMADNIRYGYKHKLRYYYAEAYPTEEWREGPKLYILLKLLWNPEQDVDVLLKEWCELAVGKKAGKSLLAYFNLWETFWTEQIPQSQWFKKNRISTFLPFRGYGYLEELTAKNMATAEHLLRESVNNTKTDKEKLRAEFFLNSFLKNKKTINTYMEFLALNNSTNKHKQKLIIEKTDFSKSTNGWTPWQRSYSKSQLIYDRNEGHNSPGCLKIDTVKSVKSPLLFSKKIPISEGKLYRWSVWIKHIGLSQEANIKLTLKWKDADNNWMINRKKGNDVRPLNISADTTSEENIWQKTEIIFKGPTEDAAYAVCMLIVEGSDRGTVYFDDIMFEELTN